METTSFYAYATDRSAGVIKESIQDMIRIQRDYPLSDELFWQIFNIRVLLNEQIDINAFLRNLNYPVI